MPEPGHSSTESRLARELFLHCSLQPYEATRFASLTLKGNNMPENQQSTSNEEIEKKAGKPAPAQNDEKETPAGNENSNPVGDANDVGSTGDYSR